MKIRIEVDPDIDEEVIIKCKKIDNRITDLQKMIASESKKKGFIFYKDEKEYYFNINDILFFETDGEAVSAHTVDDSFIVKYKLYELESILPLSFIRVSKSSILNINHIYSINRNITSSSIVEFSNTHKKVYVSRMYYRILKEKIGRRISDEK